MERIEAKFHGEELQGTLASGAKIAYRFRESGDLEFHYQRNADWLAGVLSRDSEELSRKADAYLAERVAKPGPDVPESCVRFFGGWAGDWRKSQGQQRLWVLGIKADCKAQISYRTTSSNAIPTALVAAEIRQGVLKVPCGDGGECAFEVRGDEVWGTYTNPFGGSNSGVFQKIK